MRKKILLSVAFVAVFALIAWAALQFLEGDGDGGGDIFPGSAGENGNSNNEGEGGEDEIFDATGASRGLRKLTETGVAGATFVLGENGEVTVRYIERETGNVFDIPVDETAPTRVTNTTIPRIQEAFFGNDGREVVMRYLDEGNEIIETFSGVVTSYEGGEPGTIEGKFLPRALEGVAVAPQGKTLFYLAAGEHGAVGSTAALDGTNSKQLFTSPLSEWIVEWPSDARITLLSKPSQNIFGSFYSVSAQNGAQSVILEALPGLSARMSPDGEHVLYTTSKTGEGLRTSVLTLKGAETRGLSITTFPEKCVWGTQRALKIYCGIPENLPEATYPDGWYQGVVTFRDGIVEIDAGTGGVRTLFTRGEGGTSFDLVDPQISSDGEYLIFKNKTDSTLWLLPL